MKVLVDMAVYGRVDVSMCANRRVHRGRHAGVEESICAYESRQVHCQSCCVIVVPVSQLFPCLSSSVSLFPCLSCSHVLVVPMSQFSNVSESIRVDIAVCRRVHMIVFVGIEGAHGHMGGSRGQMHICVGVGVRWTYVRE